MASRSGPFLLPGRPPCGRTALYWSLSWDMATGTRATSQLSVPPKSKLQVVYFMGAPGRAEATVTSRDAILFHIHNQACRRSFLLHLPPHPFPWPLSEICHHSYLFRLPPTHTHPHHFCQPAKTPPHTLTSLLTHTLTHSWSCPYHCLAAQYQFWGLWH